MRHPDLWKGWPCAKLSDDQIIGMMRNEGLVSARANDYDIMDFGKLIAAARKQISNTKYGRIGK